MIEHVLYWRPSGLRISYISEMNGDFLHIQDLNPEKEIRWSMAPLELLGLGFWCIWRSMVR